MNIFLKEFIKRAIATKAIEIKVNPQPSRLRLIKPKIQIKIQKPRLPKSPIPKALQITPTKIKKSIQKPLKPLIEKPIYPVKKNLLQSVSINELMQNPAVISLECKGPNTQLILKTRAGPSTINKTLSLEEINDIIQKFSEESHIPIISEVFRAVVNNMMITASLSNPETPQFIITKLSGK